MANFSGIFVTEKGNHFTTIVDHLGRIVVFVSKKPANPIKINYNYSALNLSVLGQPS